MRRFILTVNGVRVGAGVEWGDGRVTYRRDGSHALAPAQSWDKLENLKCANRVRGNEEVVALVLDVLWGGPNFCVRCGKQVEPARNVYAIPHCYACLPPPPPVETIEIPDCCHGVGLCPSSCPRFIALHKTTPPTSETTSPTTPHEESNEAPEVGGAQTSLADVARLGFTTEARARSEVQERIQREKDLEASDALDELKQFMLTRGKVLLQAPPAHAVAAATRLILELEARLSRPEAKGKLPSERLADVLRLDCDENLEAHKRSNRLLTSLLKVLDERLGRAQ